MGYKGIVENNNYIEGMDYFNLAIDICPKGDLLINGGIRQKRLMFQLFSILNLFRIFIADNITKSEVLLYKY